MTTSTKCISITSILLAFLWVNPAISSVIGITAMNDSHMSTLGDVGIQDATGKVTYFIPLNDADSGVYGVDNTPTCGTGGANTGGAGTCSDMGSGSGYDTADALTMYLYFDLSSFTNKDNAKLDIWFHDLDLEGIHDPNWFLESVSVSAKNGTDPLQDIGGGASKLDSDIPTATQDPFTWSLILASLGPLHDDFWIQLGFGSDSDYKAWNTAEYLRATISAVPIPSSLWLFGTALVGFIGFARRRTI